jgi:hypothetical protein
MFNLTLFRHHPTITEIKNYQKALKFYIVFGNNLEDFEIQQKKFMVCNDVYFQDYFTGGATTPKKVEITRLEVIAFGLHTERYEIKYCESGKNFSGDLVLL